MRKGTQIAIVTAVHLVLTIGVSLGAWAAQAGGAPTTTAQALLSAVVPLSYVFNFPIPFLLRNNSLLIMLCNSVLFGCIAVSIRTLWRKLRKNTPEVPTTTTRAQYSRADAAALVWSFWLDK